MKIKINNPKELEEKIKELTDRLNNAIEDIEDEHKIGMGILKTISQDLEELNKG